jgi:hypothetical protein
MSVGVMTPEAAVGLAPGLTAATGVDVGVGVDGWQDRANKANAKIKAYADEDAFTKFSFAIRNEKKLTGGLAAFGTCLTGRQVKWTQSSLRRKLRAQDCA